jgi:hypothetical protein
MAGSTAPPPARSGSNGPAYDRVADYTCLAVQSDLETKKTSDVKPKS